MRDFAERFYKSKRWQANRDAYARSVGGLCEACAKQGLVVPGEIVHHKTELTPENIHDPSITLDWSNLELVCRECHALRHPKSRHRRRYVVDAQGYVMACETAPPVSPKGMPWETGGREVEIPLARGKGGAKDGRKNQRTADQGGVPEAEKAL